MNIALVDILDILFIKSKMTLSYRLYVISFKLFFSQLPKRRVLLEAKSFLRVHINEENSITCGCTMKYVRLPFTLFMTGTVFLLLPSFWNIPGY